MTSPGAISIDAAIRRAFWTVKVPSLALMFGPWIGYIIASTYFDVPRYGIEGMKIFLPSFILGFVGGWLAWSIQTPRWRLWAYERVDDVAALKARAVAAQYIWPDGHAFERTEIASASMKSRIRELEALKTRRVSA